MDCSPLGSSVHGILWARILECTAIPFFRIFPTQGSNLGIVHWRQILYSLSHTGKPPNKQKNNNHIWSEVKWSEVAQLCLTICDPMACSLSGSSVHGIFQARVLEWIAISFSRGYSLTWFTVRIKLINISRSNCQHPLDHRKNKGIPEKLLLLLHWLC